MSAESSLRFFISWRACSFARARRSSWKRGSRSISTKMRRDSSRLSARQLRLPRPGGGGGAGGDPGGGGGQAARAGGRAPAADAHGDRDVDERRGAVLGDEEDHAVLQHAPVVAGRR